MSDICWHGNVEPTCAECHPTCDVCSKPVDPMVRWQEPAGRGVLRGHRGCVQAEIRQMDAEGYPT